MRRKMSRRMGRRMGEFHEKKFIIDIITRSFFWKIPSRRATFKSTYFYYYLALIIAYDCNNNMKESPPLYSSHLRRGPLSLETDIKIKAQFFIVLNSATKLLQFDVLGLMKRSHANVEGGKIIRH